MCLCLHLCRYYTRNDISFSSSLLKTEKKMKRKTYSSGTYYDHRIPHIKLLMVLRPDDDEMKYDAFTQNIAHHFNVVFGRKCAVCTRGSKQNSEI